MATEGVHYRSVEEYEDLVGYVFEGQYLGVKQNKDYGTWRAVFEVDSYGRNYHELMDKLNEIRKWNYKSQAVMWRGFTGQEDYKHNPDWETWIWAPKSCGLDDTYEDQIMDFEITDVQFFEFNQSNYHDYEVGVNIRVEVFDSFRRLERDYEDLEDVQFIGRYIGDRCDSAGNWRSVYEVDADVPFNEELVEKIDDVRQSWKQDGRRVMKSFTDSRDSYKGYDWDLWIWGTQNEELDSNDEDEEMKFTIRSAELNDCGSGRYKHTADIEVCTEW